MDVGRVGIEMRTLPSPEDGLIDPRSWFEDPSKPLEIEIGSGKKVQIHIKTIAEGNDGDTLEYRILLLDSGVEKERISISPLLIKEEVERDGEALATQISNSQMSVVMYLITMCAMSYAVWMMVQIRRIRRGEEIDESDQTAEVVSTMEDNKLIPDVPNFDAQVPVQHTGSPPLPPDGLPAGWTMEQWEHYGEQYLSSMGSN